MTSFSLVELLGTVLHRLIQGLRPLIFLLIGCFQMIAANTGSAAEELRTWADATGRFSIRGTFVKMNGARSCLRLESGAKKKLNSLS